MRVCFSLRYTYPRVYACFTVGYTCVFSGTVYDMILLFFCFSIFLCTMLCARARRVLLCCLFSLFFVMYIVLCFVLQVGCFRIFPQYCMYQDMYHAHVWRVVSLCLSLFRFCCVPFLSGRNGGGRRRRVAVPEWRSGGAVRNGFSVGRGVRS